MKAPDLSRLLHARDRADLLAANVEVTRERFDRLRDRHTNGDAPRAVSAYQLFQTPAPLAARMVELAGIRSQDTVLEPSAGLGRLLVPILAARPAAVHAVEIDDTLAGELYQSFPSVGLTQRDFLSVPPRPSYSRIVTNPPFHMRADIAHTLHALQFLTNPGVLVGLCLNTHHREAALRPLSNHWEVIPTGAFAAEGTRVETVLFRITTNH